jgi:hypothetical protein
MDIYETLDILPSPERLKVGSPGGDFGFSFAMGIIALLLGFIDPLGGLDNFSPGQELVCVSNCIQPLGPTYSRSTPYVASSYETRAWVSIVALVAGSFWLGRALRQLHKDKR